MWGSKSSRKSAGLLSTFRKRALSCIVDFAGRPDQWLLAFRSFVKLIGNWLSSIAGGSPREEFRLLSIAVATSATRKGVGTALVSALPSETLSSLSDVPGGKRGSA